MIFRDMREMHEISKRIVVRIFFLCWLHLLKEC